MTDWQARGDTLRRRRGLRRLALLVLVTAAVVYGAVVSTGGWACTSAEPWC